MQSVWMIGRSAGDYPALSGSHQVDTVVVGGGITGVSTAWELHRAGQRVALLEAGTVGGGSTGHATGNLYGTVSGGLAALRQHWPAEVVREMVALRLQAVQRIEQRVAELDIECAFARRPLYTAMADTATSASLQEEFDAAADAGLAPRWLEGTELSMGTVKAFSIGAQAQFNPYLYTRALAGALAARGVQVHEHSGVVEMDAGEGWVATAQGRIQAKQIVLATHTPVGINLVQTEMPVYRECGIAARLSQGTYPQGIFWVRDAHRSVRSYHAPEGDFLVVVGEMHKPGHEQDRQFDALRDYAGRHFDVAEFTHAWSAQQYRSADGLPYIGASGHRNVFMATGFGADGLTWGTLAGGLITDLILGREHAASERLSPRRFTPLKSAKAWIAETRVVFDHLVVHRLRDAPLSDLSQLGPGQGGLVELDGTTCAAYRSPAGELAVVSSACTHMGCQVHWNPVATSWDCPCHGSRFDTDGQVIEGPALRPLERVGNQH